MTRRLRLIASPLTVKKNTHPLRPHHHGEHHHNEHHHADHHHKHEPEPPPVTPQFHKHHEARPIELFYDLFFVGNLSVFTYIHPVNDSESLRSYIGFFSLLWFTWLQVTLFDVRFGGDSIVERLMKFFQLAGMVGFCVTGPTFLPSELAKDTSLQVAFSCILMGTRLALCIQYLVTYWASRKLETSRTPLLLHIGAYFSSAVAYAIMAGFASRGNTSAGYAAWYVLAAFETASTVVIARKHKIASFRGTHLAERLSLLTLIIIGEGIIVLFKSIQAIVTNGNGSTPTTISNIFCITVIYFCLYMLYFDKLRKSYFGLIREEIWTLLHYPFHVALILFVEGISELMLARRFYEEADKWAQIYVSVPTQANATSGTLGELLYAKQLLIAAEFPDAVTKGKDLQTASFAYLALNSTNIPVSVQTMMENKDANTILGYWGDIIFSSLGLKQSKFDSSLGLIDRLGADFEIFQLIFGYLFVAGGLILMLLALLLYITKSHNSRLSAPDWINIVVHVTTGFAIALVSLLLIQRPDFTPAGAATLIDLGKEATGFTDLNAFNRFAMGPWVLPSTVFCYVYVVIVSLVTQMVPQKEDTAPEVGHDELDKLSSEQHH